MQDDFDRELQTYFTDVEHLRELFKQWLAAPALSKRALVIHGVGGCTARALASPSHWPWAMSRNPRSMCLRAGQRI